MASCSGSHGRWFLSRTRRSGHCGPWGQGKPLTCRDYLGTRDSMLPSCGAPCPGSVLPHALLPLPGSLA